MTSTRQNKVSRLLQKELGEILQQEAKNLFKGKMLSVTNVRITPDLGLARVYISIFPNLKDQDYLSVLESNQGRFRYELGNRVRHQLRIVPEIQFIIDDSLDYVENIENLLKK